MTSCIVEGCDTPAKARDMCQKHYQRAYRDRRNGRPVRFADELVARPRGERAKPTTYEPLARVADLLARLAAARARITQALLVLEHPRHAFGADPKDLLRDALDELDPHHKETP